MFFRWHPILWPFRHARSISDVTHILGNVSKMMFFNVENPTGHYRLEMTALWQVTRDDQKCQAGSLQPSRLQRSWKPRKALRDFFLAENRYSCWIGTDWRHGRDFTSLKYSQLGFVCSISSIRSTNLQRLGSKYPQINPSWRRFFLTAGKLRSRVGLRRPLQPSCIIDPCLGHLVDS